MVPYALIDTHLHIWDIHRLHYPWLADVPPIQRTFTLTDYGKATTDLPIQKLVFVQCECLPEQYEQEITYVTQAAQTDPRLQGMIVWFPLEEPDVTSRLQQLVANPLVRGIRRLEESPVSLYDQPQFVENLRLIPRFTLTFDLCLKAHQLPAAIRLVQQCPEVSFMLDHLGKPAIRQKELTTWKACIRVLAGHSNVFCKVSGLVTEADWQHWTIDDLRPYVEYAVEQFGPDRLVFGGDWPVVTLASSYHRWLDTLLLLCEGCSSDERSQFFYRNAERFYRL